MILKGVKHFFKEGFFKHKSVAKKFFLKSEISLNLLLSETNNAQKLFEAKFLFN